MRVAPTWTVPGRRAGELVQLGHQVVQAFARVGPLLRGEPQVGVGDRRLGVRLPRGDAMAQVGDHRFDEQRLRALLVGQRTALHRAVEPFPAAALGPDLGEHDQARPAEGAQVLAREAVRDAQFGREGRGGHRTAPHHRQHAQPGRVAERAQHRVDVHERSIPPPSDC
jgi:hypothetical protein